jgi:formylmethanofuran dehydrogenase subunit E
MTMPRLELEAPWIRNAGWEKDPMEDDGVICDKCGDRVFDWYDIDGSILCDDCFDSISRKWRRHSGE